MEQDEKLGLAYHEGGHVVVARVHHFTVGWVTVIHDPDGNSEGETKIFYGPTSALERGSVKFYKQALVCALAGFFAAIYRGDRSLSVADFNLQIQTQLHVAGVGKQKGDLANVKEILSYLQDEGLDASICLFEGCTQTAALVETHWPAIKAVAVALFQAGTLTAEELNPLLKRFGLFAQ